jgi:hypothetical protein
MKAYEVIIAALACLIAAAAVGAIYYICEVYRCKRKAEMMSRRSYRHERKAPTPSLTRVLCAFLVTALVLELAFFVPFSIAKLTKNGKKPTYNDNGPVSVNSGDYSITYYEELDPSKASENKTVAQWLDKCINDKERDDIGNYILYFEDTSGEKNVYTYLIYRTLLENDCSVKFYMNESEYIITAEYTPLSTSEKSTYLCMVQVTSDKAPVDIDLIENGDYLGSLFTREYTNIADFIE